LLFVVLCFVFFICDYHVFYMGADEAAGEKGPLMWVDFYMFSFMVTFLLNIEILTIKGEDLRKILTGHELNQVVK